MIPKDFVNMIAPSAVACMRGTDVPASFHIAEAALESGWGESRLCKEAHNFFGVKAIGGWTGPTLDLPTHEVLHGRDVIVEAAWRSYPDWESCLVDHAAFLHENPRYLHAFDHKDGPGFADAVAAAGYATDPGYAAKLKAIISFHDLERYDGKEDA